MLPGFVLGLVGKHWFHMVLWTLLGAWREGWAEEFHLNMRKNFFPLRVTKPWPRLPREAVESPPLEIFQTRLAAVLCSLLWVTLLGQGVGLGDAQRSLPTPNILCS